MGRDSDSFKLVILHTWKNSEHVEKTSSWEKTHIPTVCCHHLCTKAVDLCLALCISLAKTRIRPRVWVLHPGCNYGNSCLGWLSWVVRNALRLLWKSNSLLTPKLILITLFCFSNKNQSCYNSVCNLIDSGGPLFTWRDKQNSQQQFNLYVWNSPQTRKRPWDAIGHLVGAKRIADNFSFDS